MKKIIICCAYVFFTHIALFAQSYANFPSYLVSYLEQEEISTETEIFQYMDSTSNKIRTASGSIVDLPLNGVIYFIDEEPLANWGHKCRYVWFGENSEIKSIKENLPPLEDSLWLLINKKTSDFKKNYIEVKSYPTTSHKSTATVNNHNYAVIISGGINKNQNRIRYWNDCQAIYSTLVQEYGYLDSNIYVLMSDGTDPSNDRHLNNGGFDSSPLDLDGDGDDDIQYAATKNNISIGFDTLSNKLGDDDFLFIFVTDHGQKDNNNTYLCLWGENMSTTEFAAEVNKVHAGNICIVMEQCYSGGFMSDLTADNRVIATACAAEEQSWSTIDTLYNEFVYHWISAVRGITPMGVIVNADSNNDGLISMYEAFKYAEEQDFYKNTQGDKRETPQYISTPFDLGNYLYLDRGCHVEYLLNQTIVSNTIINACYIEVTDISIGSNANVVFDAEQITTINGPFQVNIGSTLEIR